MQFSRIITCIHTTHPHTNTHTHTHHKHTQTHTYARSGRKNILVAKITWEIWKTCHSPTLSTACIIMFPERQVKVPLCSGRTGSITSVSFSWKAPFNSGNQTICSALPCPLKTSQSNVALEFLATLARGGVTLRKARCPACAFGVSGIISRKKLALVTLEDLLKNITAFLRGAWRDHCFPPQFS